MYQAWSVIIGVDTNTLSISTQVTSDKTLADVICFIPSLLSLMRSLFPCENPLCQSTHPKCCLSTFLLSEHILFRSGAASLLGFLFQDFGDL